jgi:voltage-gated sodium channel
MFARETVGRIADSPAVETGVILTICVGVLLLVSNTFGYDTFWLDKSVLAVFTLEAAAKIYARGWGYFSRGWNRFDFSIVVVGWLVVFAILLAIPMPEGVAALARVLRIVRLAEKIPSINRVLQTLYASLGGLTGALLLAVLAMGIFVLAGTLMFQPLPPFANLASTFWHLTLLFEEVTDLFKETRSTTFGLYLQIYQLVMSLTIINLVITALIDGMQKAQEILHRHATRADVEEVLQELASVKQQGQEDRAKTRDEIAQLKAMVAKLADDR